MSARVFLGAPSIPSLLSEANGRSASLLIPGLVACLAWPLILGQLDLYESQRRRGVGQRLALASSISTALGAASTGLSGAPVQPLFALVVGTGPFVLLSRLRLTTLAGVRVIRRRGHNFRNVLIVGTGGRARHLLHQLQRHPERGLRVIGFMDEHATPPQRSPPGHRRIALPGRRGGASTRRRSLSPRAGSREKVWNRRGVAARFAHSVQRIRSRAVAGTIRGRGRSAARRESLRQG